MTWKCPACRGSETLTKSGPGRWSGTHECPLLPNITCGVEVYL